MDSSAVAYDTPDISESARDSGLSEPPASGALNAEGGVGVTITDLRGLALAVEGILEVKGGARDAKSGDESTTGGDKGAAASESRLGCDTSSAGCAVSAVGASCRLSLDDE